MRINASLRARAMAIFVFLWTCPLLLSQQKQLTPEQQTAFLVTRTGRPNPGSFDSVCSYLYAVRALSIHTNSKRINATRITPTFPAFYQPTWKELFNLIAIQTRSEWNYDPEQGYWVFREAKIGLPYQLKVAAGWQANEGPFIVNYQPPKLAPVGMDVYWLGSYSADGNDAILGRVREDLSMQLIRGNIKDASPERMSKVQIGKAEAFYYQALTNAGVVWRQWVLIDKGQAFMIVSAIKPEHEKVLLPDVLAMVNSFEVADPRPVQDR